MKAIEAPEKIYIDISLDSDWGMSKRSYDNEVEYTRTDAFIDKAWDWLRFNRWKYEDSREGNEAMEKDFKNYMKGE